MRPPERRKRILELVQQNDRVSVDGLSEQLAISRETIRRDLAILSEQGLLRKVHGGATAALLVPGAKESPLADRRANAREEKIRIACKAAELFSTGDSILINCG